MLLAIVEEQSNFVVGVLWKEVVVGNVLEQNKKGRINCCLKS